MIIVRTAGELDAFLATPLGRETEPIIAPHLERLAEYEFEDIAAIAVTDAGEPLTSLGIDPESFEYREEHPGWTERVYVLGQDGWGWIVLTRIYSPTPPTTASVQASRLGRFFYARKDFR